MYLSSVDGVVLSFSPHIISVGDLIFGNIFRRLDERLIPSKIDMITNYFSPKGDGMLPGDIVWDFIKKTGRKLEYEEGHVIDKGAEGFQCKDCKYYMYTNRCLLIKGNGFMPEMSCAFVVKIDNGTEV